MSDTENKRETAADVLSRALDEELLSQAGRYYYDADGNLVAGSRDEALEWLFSLPPEDYDLPPLEIEVDDPAEAPEVLEVPTLAGPYRFEGVGAVNYSRAPGKLGTLYPYTIYNNLPKTNEIQTLIDRGKLVLL